MAFAARSLQLLGQVQRFGRVRFDRADVEQQEPPSRQRQQELTALLNLLGIELEQRRLHIPHRQGPLSERLERTGTPLVKVDLEPEGLRPLGLELERPKRDVEEPRRLFVRQAVRGPIARPYRVGDRFVHVACRGRL
jgi:hypothetical protein